MFSEDELAQLRAFPDPARAELIRFFTLTPADEDLKAVAHLGWHQVDGPRWKDLEEFLFARATEHDSPKLLFRQACEYLSSSRLVRPGVVNILERVATAGPGTGRDVGAPCPRC